MSNKTLDTADCCETLDEARRVIRRLEAKVERFKRQADAWRNINNRTTDSLDRLSKAVEHSLIKMSGSLRTALYEAHSESETP